jgi:rubrerythrin
VQWLNNTVFVQFNARINDQKILRKFDHLCAREEEHDDNVRERTAGHALDLSEEIYSASVASSSAPS